MTTIRVKRKDLKSALSAVKPALAKGKIIPAMDGILVESTPGRISLTATDFDVRATAHVPIPATLMDEAGAEEASGVAPADLITLVSKMTGKEVQLSLGDGLKMTDGGELHALETLPAVDYPAFDLEGGEVALQMEAAVLREALSVAWAGQAESPIPVYRLVQIHSDGARVTGVATSGYMVARTTVSHMAPRGEMVMPVRLAEIASKVCTSGHVAVWRHAGRLDPILRFCGEDGTASGFYQERRFPRWEHLNHLVHKARSSGQVSRKALLDVLREVRGRKDVIVRGDLLHRDRIILTAWWWNRELEAYEKRCFTVPAPAMPGREVFYLYPDQWWQALQWLRADEVTLLLDNPEHPVGLQAGNRLVIISPITKAQTWIDARETALAGA